MRLIDMVMQVPATGADGGARAGDPLGAPGSLAPSLSSCTLRYVLDRPASERCAAIVFQRGGPLSRPDELVRLPARPFWLECFMVGGESEQRLQRVGLLVDPRPNGMGGEIDCVFQPSDGGLRRLPARIVFDVAGGNLPAAPRTHRMRHPLEPDIDRLLGSARLVVDEGLPGHARARSLDYGEVVASLAEVGWCAVPLVLSFAALLNMRRALVHRPSSLTRLNTQRSRSGRPALLDHVEVGLNLAPDGGGGQRGPGYSVGERHAPCLHFVRGHSVTRAGSTFWRSSHFRGEGEGERTRTVRVTAGLNASRAHGGQTPDSRHA